MTRSRYASTIVAAMIVALALSSCSSNQGGASDRGGGVAEGPMPGQALPGEPRTEEGSNGSDAGDDTDETDRSVIVTASISLSDPDPIAVADDVQDIAETSGGRVDRRNDSPGTGSNPASSELVLRIPSDELDAAVSDLSDLTTVVWSSIDRQDVTGSVTDISARIGALDASIDRLLALLGNAASTSDLITIESELTARQAERDSLAAQQESLADQVEYSTVTVRIGVPGEAGEAGPGDFWGGLALGFASLGAFLSGFMVVLGVLFPWVVLLGIIAAIVWWARRRRRPRAGHRPPPVSGNGQAGPQGPPPPDVAPAAPVPAQPAAEQPAPASSSPVASVSPATPPVPPRPPLPAPARDAQENPPSTNPQTAAPATAAAPKTADPKAAAPKATAAAPKTAARKKPAASRSRQPQTTEPSTDAE